VNFLNQNKYWLLALAMVALAGWILARTVKSIRKENVKMATNPNIQAFLKLIRYAEGTAGVNGYKTLFGGKLFADYSRHPNVKNPFYNKAKGRQDYSTAAGAYQFLYSTWKGLQVALNLPDFSPESQDRAAIELIRREGALKDVEAGRLATAIDKVQNIWASLPDVPGGEKASNYMQPEKKFEKLLAIYKQNGGGLA